MLIQAFRNAARLLTPEGRRRFAWLCLMSAAAAFLEMATVASVFPFLAAVASPQLVADDSRLSRLLALLDLQSGAPALAALGGLLLLLLVATNAFSAFTAWLMFRFANRQGQALAARLLETYLWQPYPFYFNRNTSELQKNIFSEAHKVTMGVLVPGAQIVAKSALIVFILALLVAVDPMLAGVLALVLAGCYLLIFRFVRILLVDAGRRSVEANTQRTQHALESLNGVKEIKLLGREAAFLKRFTEPSLRWADAQAMGQALGVLPRYAVDTIAFGLVLLVAIYLLGREGQMSQALPLLGLYAFAGYRLLPALQQVFSGLASIRYATPAMDVVLRDLALRPEHAGSAAAPGSYGTGDIKLLGVGYRYPGCEDWAVRDVTITIPARSSIALVGATGCGKTTLVDILLGLLVAEEGQLSVGGVAITAANVRPWQRSIGHVPQQIFLCDDTIARNIAFGLPEAAIDRRRIEEVARLARLHEFVVSGLPQGYDTVVGDRGIRLSGGQRQRIGIARALYRDPEVLVLDEATSALDSVTENAVFDALQALAGRKTVIMVAHRISTVRACDSICVMEHGRIVEHGRYADLLESSQRFRALARAASH